MIKKIKQNYRKALVPVVLGLLGALLIASPVLAIANPNDIDFGSGSTVKFKAFENVQETGDMLFIAECLLDYDPAPGTPTDYTAEEAFSFQLLNVAGDTVLLQTPITGYEDTVISIYQTATQVTALGLTTATAYKLRISGNPTIFELTEGTNMVTQTLDISEGWVDQALGVNGVNSPLYIFCIAVVENIEAEMGAVHTVEISGIKLLDASGGNLFLQGVPSLNMFLPELFQSSSIPMTAEDPASTGAYQTALTPTAQLGATMARSVTQMSTWMGVNSTTAGIIVSLILAFCFLPVVYFKTRNGSVTMIVASFFALACGYMGLFPLATAFIIASAVLILTGFLFWGKISV